MPLDLTVLILAINEGKNLEYILPKINEELRRFSTTSEILILDGHSKDTSKEVALRHNARFVVQDGPFYGGALRHGFREANGNYIMTLDADCSHPVEMMQKLWSLRNTADLLVCSRYVPGGGSDAPAFRQYLSKILNLTFAKLLGLPIRDLSSGFRLYSAKLLSPDSYQCEEFEILIEVLVKAYKQGLKIIEIPFHYHPRRNGHSNAKLLKLSLHYILVFQRLWKSRNLQND